MNASVVGKGPFEWPKIRCIDQINKDTAENWKATTPDRQRWRRLRLIQGATDLQGQ